MKSTRSVWRALLALATGAAWVLVSSIPAGASPAINESEDITGDTVACATTTYTITSGFIMGTFHFDETSAGNTNFTGTITPKSVVATSTEGGTFSIQGALWFGETFNAKQDSGQGTFTGKLQIVKKGEGTVDSVNITAHVSPNDKEVFFDLGTCAVPE